MPRRRTTITPQPPPSPAEPFPPGTPVWFRWDGRARRAVVLRTGLPGTWDNIEVELIDTERTNYGDWPRDTPRYVRKTTWAGCLSRRAERD